MSPPALSKSIISQSEFKQAEDFARLQLLAALQERQLDEEPATGDLPAGLLDELRPREHRPPRRQQVVDQQHAGAVRDTVSVHLELGTPVFELVLEAVSSVRQL